MSLTASSPTLAPTHLPLAVGHARRDRSLLELRQPGTAHHRRVLVPFHVVQTLPFVALLACARPAVIRHVQQADWVSHPFPLRTTFGQIDDHSLLLLHVAHQVPVDGRSTHYDALHVVRGVGAAGEDEQVLIVICPRLQYDRVAHIGSVRRTHCVKLVGVAHVNGEGRDILPGIVRPSADDEEGLLCDSWTKRGLKGA